MFVALAPKGPLADPRVRQALNYAIDKKAIIDNVLFGLGLPADAPIPPHFSATRLWSHIHMILRRLRSY